MSTASILFSVARAHNAAIDARREPDDTPPRGSAVEEHKKHWEKPARKIVYVVDDEWDIREMLREVLVTAYDVSTFGNGFDALKQLHAEYILSNGARLPNLILLDLMMPVMDGLKFFAVLQGSDKFRDIPVVVITASANQDGWPWVHTIQKPIDFDELIRVVERQAR